MRTLKNSKLLVSGVIITGALALGGVKTASADELPTTRSNGVLSKADLGEGNYCHLQFPAIRPSTLDTDHPQLKSPNTGDIIDYYGPCDHDPLGKDEVLSQRHDYEFRWDRRDYNR